ncbi:hypothetical protein BH09PAT3_BH09PAT3_7200 [soil metagenome]
MTDDEINQLAKLLGKLEPGFVPYPIFEQALRIFAMPVYEVVPLRLNDQDEIEVLLIDRGPEDPIWPNMLHTPGTIIRSTDVPDDTTHNQQALKRITDDELKGTPVSEPHYFGSMLHKSKRGVEQAQLHWVEVLGEPVTGTFHPVDNLPSTLIDSQVTVIDKAVRNFGGYKEGLNASL